MMATIKRQSYKWVGLLTILLLVLVYFLITYKFQLKYDHIEAEVKVTPFREGRDHSGKFNTRECYKMTELDTLKYLAERHVLELEGVRDSFLKRASHENITISGINDTAIPKQKNYFDKLSQYQEIETLFLSHPFSVVRENLRQEYYQFGSDNCNLTEELAERGQGYSLQMFNKSCQSDLNILLKPGPLESNRFLQSMPEVFDQTDENVTLTYLSVIPNAVVYGSGNVRYKSLRIVPQRGKLDTPLLKTEGDLHEEVFTIAQWWGAAYFHVIAQHLPRITPYVDFLKRHPTIRIHVTYHVSHIHTCLRALGISTDRVVTGTIRARILYFPAGNSEFGSIYVTQLFSAYMRSIFLKKADLSQTDIVTATSDKIQPTSERGVNLNEPRNTVILQHRSKKRYFLNHTAIAMAIERESNARGFRLVIFSDTNLPSFPKTIALYDSAVLVIAPHGAGETNMMFARPGTPLIEALCQTPIFCYRDLNQNLGHPYYATLRPDINCFATEPSDLLPAVTFFLDNLQNQVEI